jgi:hypothetical protein
MTDPRLKDSIRSTEAMVKDLVSAFETLMEQQVQIQKDLRSIKESVVRKYSKK